LGVPEKRYSAECVKAAIQIHIWIQKTRKEGEHMALTEKQQRVLDTFTQILPYMSDLEAERLLSYGEGIAFKTSQQKGKENATETKPCN